jgi:hypothetical protein
MDSTPIKKILSKINNKKDKKYSEDKKYNENKNEHSDDEDENNDKQSEDNDENEDRGIMNKIMRFENIKQHIMTIIITVIAHILLSSRIVVNAIRQISHGTLTDENGHHYNMKGKILEGTIATIIGLLVSLINK